MGGIDKVININHVILLSLYRYQMEFIYLKNDETVSITEMQNFKKKRNPINSKENHEKTLDRISLIFFRGWEEKHKFFLFFFFLLKEKKSF
jgi:hypothetical protein